MTVTSRSASTKLVTRVTGILNGRERARANTAIQMRCREMNV
jgi:hypothetical protein